MTAQTTETTAGQAAWQPKLVYGMAGICLLLGLSVGYLLRGSAAHATSAQALGASALQPDSKAQTPTLEQMKQMAGKKVEPLLQQLKKDPTNKDLLVRIAYFYKSAHQFQEATKYLDQALQSDPKNVALRTEKASCLYYNGEVDGALAELQESLKLRPSDANALFNLGMIRLNGKQDPAGAIAAWQQLLKSNPKLDKKPVVEQMIAEARQQQRSSQRPQ